MACDVVIKISALFSFLALERIGHAHTTLEELTRSLNISCTAWIALVILSGIGDGSSCSLLGWGGHNTSLFLTFSIHIYAMHTPKYINIRIWSQQPFNTEYIYYMQYTW